MGAGDVRIVYAAIGPDRNRKRRLFGVDVMAIKVGVRAQGREDGVPNRVIIR